MKIYSKIVFDKDMNVIEEESYEYKGPVAMCGGSPPPPSPPPAPPPPPPAPSPTPPTTYRTTGRALQRGRGGRGVLVRPSARLGAAQDPSVAFSQTARKNLLQPTEELGRSLLRLLGGGY